MCSNINRLTAHKRHFPLILRAAGLLLIVLIAAIAGTTLITRAARTGADCLLVVDYALNRVLIDPYAQHVVTLHPLYTATPSLSDTVPLDSYFVSPDRTHVARLVPNTDPSQPPHLIISATNAHLHQSGIDNSISWSSDSQWIAYISQPIDGNIYLSISNVNGHAQKNVSLGSAIYIIFGGWTDGAKYLAVIRADTKGQHLTFWNVAALTRVTLSDSQERLLESCRLPGIDTTNLEHSLNLSPHRQFFTCNIYSEEKVQVILFDLDKNKIISFDFPPNTYYDDASTSALWSTSGNYLAIASFDSRKGPRSSTRLSILNTDTLLVQNVDDIYQTGANANISSGYPLMEWSFDGKTLAYMRHNQYGFGKVLDMMLYQPDTKTYRYWLSTKPMEGIRFVSFPNEQAGLGINYGAPGNRMSFLFVDNFEFDGDRPFNTGAYGMHWLFNGTLLAVGIIKPNGGDVRIDFFDKNGAFIYRAKSIYLTEDNAAWTSCKPDGFDLGRRAT